MPTNTSSTTFPTTLDTLPDLPSTNDRSDAAVIALQTKVGADSSTDATSLDYKVRREAVAAFSSDGALTVVKGVKALTKAGVGAYTLAAPTAAQEGTIIRIVAATANAHVVTATGLIDDGVTGGSKNTMTFGAFIGASITLIAYNLKWVVLAKNVVTVAA